MQPVSDRGGNGAPARGTSRDAHNACTLYVGNLHPCVTTAALQEICAYFGRVEQVKLIKDKATGQNAGYGFVRFSDRQSATLALNYLQSKVFYAQELKVNWAFQSHQREDTSTHWQIFVGDLGQEVTDGMLFGAFSELPGCSDARVMWDHATGRSKGYGFVSMRTREEAQAAIEVMHGVTIGSRRVRCGWAQHKQEDLPVPMEFDALDKIDPVNCNVYVGNIAPDWQEEDIQEHFAGFGEIAEVKLHKKGGYGFIRYQKHEDAVKAIIGTHNQVIHGRQVKVSWGKNASGTSSKPPSGRRPGAYPGPQGPQPLLLPPMAPAMGGYLGSAPGMMPGLLGPQGVLQGALYGAGPGPGLRALPPQLADGPMGHHHPGQQRYPAQPSRGAPHVSPVQPHVSPVAHPGAHLVGQGSPLLGSSQGMAAAVGGLAASPVAAAAAAAVAAAAAAGGGMSLPPASMTTAGILPGMMQQAAAANQYMAPLGVMEPDLMPYAANLMQTMPSGPDGGVSAAPAGAGVLGPREGSYHGGHSMGAHSHSPYGSPSAAAAAAGVGPGAGGGMLYQIQPGFPYQLP